MAALYADSQLWNKESVFKDRFDAGNSLGEFMASTFEGMAGTVVLAIPAGGVPVGIELSKRLGLPFDCLIVRKIQIPGNTEAGFGAMTSGGEVLLNQELVDRLGLTQEQIEKQMGKVRKELTTRERMLRGSRPLLDLSGMNVIITDDGLASGFTMLAAIDAVRHQAAQKVVVAVPTALLHSVRKVEKKADAVYSLHVQQGGPFAVANAYQNWYDLSMDEVAQLLKEMGPVTEH